MSLSGLKQESVRISRTEEFFHKIYQQVATGIAITNWQGVFQECNPAYCALVGYTEKELRDIGFASLIHRMKERLKLVGGELSLETQLQRGTTIHARVPLRTRSRAASATTKVSQST